MPFDAGAPTPGPPPAVSWHPLQTPRRRSPGFTVERGFVMTNHDLATAWTSQADTWAALAQAAAVFNRLGHLNAHVVSYYRHLEQVAIGRALDFVELVA